MLANDVIVYLKQCRKRNCVNTIKKILKKVARKREDL